MHYGWRTPAKTGIVNQMLTFSARGKVKRLDAHIRNVPYKDWVPVDVNTRIKVIGFAGTAFVVLFGASYLVVSVLDLHGGTVLDELAELEQLGLVRRGAPDDDDQRIRRGQRGVADCAGQVAGWPG